MVVGHYQKAISEAANALIEFPILFQRSFSSSFFSFCFVFVFVLFCFFFCFHFLDLFSFYLELVEIFRQDGHFSLLKEVKEAAKVSFLFLSLKKKYPHLSFSDLL